MINRGNYRAWIFEDEGARRAFEATLFEACERAGWVLHAFCIMGNHFHLALETPDGNLTTGMRWLQSVFATRFNRFRKERGHLFQGRFKSVIVEDMERLGWVCHYIHLNPVRARLCVAADLKQHRWSSFWFLKNPRERPRFLNLDTCLAAAGKLRDDTVGRAKYAQYLRWLAEDRPTQKVMAFDAMSSGWVLGSGEFRKELAAEMNAPSRGVRLSQAEVREVQDARWSGRLERCMKSLRKNSDDARDDPKSANWKIAIAAYMKSHGLCTNRWLAERLNMGVEFSVSRYVSEAQSGVRAEAARLVRELIANAKE